MYRLAGFLALIVVLSLSVSAAPNSGLPEHEVCGHITADTTWTVPESPYLITCTENVDSGVTLAIEPGVTVRFEEGSRQLQLIVDGTLRAQGTADDPVLFTSNSGSPTAGDWPGIVFTGRSANSLLDHVVVEYGGLRGFPAVFIMSSSVRVSNSIIRHNQGEGIDVFDASPTIRDNTITGNAIGVNVRTSTSAGLAAPTINGNDIHDNSEYGVYNADGDTCVNALNNWWGSDLGPSDPSNASDACGLGAHAGPGDKVSDSVNYEPWMTRGTVARVVLPLVLRCWPLHVPAAPTLFHIDNPDGDGAYSVTWSGVCGAQYYTLQEDDVPSFVSPATVYSGTDTSKVISGRGIGTYYYRVNASNSVGSGNWSNVKSVVVTVPPTVSTPLPGRWHGSGHNFTFDFTVSNDSSQVTDKQVTFRCGSSSSSVTMYIPSSIVDGQFVAGSGTATSGINIRGTFSTSTSVSGTWNGWIYPFTCSGDWTGAHE